MDTVTATDLLNSTDQLINDLYTANWKSSLRFPGCVLCHESSTYEENEQVAADIDIFECCGNNIYKSWVIRFDPKTYNIPDEDTADKFGHGTDGWKLVLDITKMLADEGQGNFVSNGSKSHCRGIRREIVCSRNRLYQNRSKVNDPVFRDVTLRTNNGNCGQKKDVPTKKCTTTSLPVQKNEKCYCRIQIGVDKNSYYVVASNGSAMHCGHPRTDRHCIATKKRHISPECLETVKEYAFCKTSVGSAMLASSFTHNAHLSRRQCTHLMQSECLKVAFQETQKDVGDDTKWTAPEEMFHLFKQKKIVFGMLYHRKDVIAAEQPGWEAKQRKRKEQKKIDTALNIERMSNDTVHGPVNQNDDVMVTTMQVNQNAFGDDEVVTTNNENDSNGSGGGVCLFETFLPEECDDDNSGPTAPTILHDPDPLKLANNCRKAYDANDNQDVVLSLVWSMPETRRAFRAYPEVLFIDGTHKTNNEKYPLFTVGIRDENFKMLVVLRAFCPNERSWMFGWLFKEAIPSLLGFNACKRVKTIITDGDSQETKELDAAIALGIFGDAKRRRCGWHIVHQGCKNILLKRFICSSNMTDALKEVIQVVKVWIQQSLMKDVESAREYEISKALLLNYVASKHVGTSIGELNAANMLNFLRDHIFVHEEFFAAYKYNFLRSFCDYSNTPLEGTNGGLKYGYFAVEPHMKISKSASYMICQDEYKHDIRKRTAYNNQFKTKLYDICFNDNKETKHITPKALGEMRRQIHQAHSYCSIRVNCSTWIVRDGREPLRTASLRLVPQFLRFRCVKKDIGRGFICTCPFTSMYGIPCRHVAHVLQYYCKSCYVFSHHDVDVRWWTTYANFVAIMEPSTSDNGEGTIREKLQRIRRSVELKIGDTADLSDFVDPTYKHGDLTSESMKGLPFDVANTDLFPDQMSHPTNYNHLEVEIALEFLRNTHGGIKKTFTLRCDSDDDGDNDGGDGGDVMLCDGADDDDTNDRRSDVNTTLFNYSTRTVTADEEVGKQSDRYMEMKSIFKQLMSHLEDVDDEYYNRVKKQSEHQVTEAHEYVIRKTRSYNKNQSTLLSCLPINDGNTTRKHKRQEKKY